MSEIEMVDLKQIQPNKLNPRIKAGPGGLDDLAASIEQFGLLHPITVRRAGDHYEVVVGERRYRAAQQAGLDQVPVIVREYTDEEVMEINLLENIQRDDLSAVDKAKLCVSLREQFPERYPNLEDLARRIGVEPPTVRAWLRTLGLPEEVQKRIAPRETSRVPAGKIGYQTALRISERIKTPERQREVAEALATTPMPRHMSKEVIRRAGAAPARPVLEIAEEVLRSAPKPAATEPRAESFAPDTNGHNGHSHDSANGHNGAALDSQAARAAEERAAVALSRANEPPSLSFSPRNFKAVVEGRKTQITRRRPDPALRPGAIVRGQVPHFADLEIVRVERKRLGDLTDEDAQREGSTNRARFQEQWTKQYGSWSPDEFVHLIEFRVVRLK